VTTSAEETVVLGEVDRFLVPLEEKAILEYFRRRLFVPHRVRERLARWLLPGRALFSHRLIFPPPAPPADAGGSVEDVLAVISRGLRDGGRELLRDTALAGRRLRWIAFRGDAFLQRGRLVLFLFAEGGAVPSAVVKLRAARGAPALQQERDALLSLAARLPADLRASVPRPLAFRAEEGLEALVLTFLAGRSAYVEMQSSRAAGRGTGRHLQAAGAWLARFHAATRCGSVAIEREEAVPLAAAHGDFWARNLLLEEDGTARVVDWEGFRAAAPVFEDLFHFPLTYGLNALWSRYRRRPPLEAFRLTFCSDGPLAREVRRYFARYCAESGLEPARLLPLFQLHLATRAAGGLDFRPVLASAERTVFSP
jgi:hypothetical protein